MTKVEAKLRDFICMVLHKLTGTLYCPYCWKDMTIRPGAVFACHRKVCPQWRIGFNG